MRHVALAAVRGALLAAGSAAGEEPRAVTGAVQDPEGRPASGVEAVLEVGRARYPLSEHFDPWESVRSDRSTSGSDGTFTLHETTLEVAAGAAPQTRDVVLP